MTGIKVIVKALILFCVVGLVHTQSKATICYYYWYYYYWHWCIAASPEELQRGDDIVKELCANSELWHAWLPWFLPKMSTAPHSTSTSTWKIIPQKMATCHLTWGLCCALFQQKIRYTRSVLFCLRDSKNLVAALLSSGQLVNTEWFKTCTFWRSVICPSHLVLFQPIHFWFIPYDPCFHFILYCCIMEAL